LNILFYEFRDDSTIFAICRMKKRFYHGESFRLFRRILCNLGSDYFCRAWRWFLWLCPWQPEGKEEGVREEEPGEGMLPEIPIH
jgi:hypothetical protein